MKTWIKYAKKLRRDLAILFAVCLVIAIGIAFTIPQLAHDNLLGKSLLDLLQKLCLSYISSFVFYFLVVHFKSEKDKANIFPYVLSQCREIAVCGKLLNGWLGHRGGDSPTVSDIAAACRNIRMKQRKAIIDHPPDGDPMFEVMVKHHRTSTLQNIDKVMRISPHIEPELVKLLMDIEHCRFYSRLAFLPDHFDALLKDEKNTSEHILEYLELCKKLQNYVDKNQRPVT